MIWAYPLCSCETNEEDSVQVSQYFEKETDMENIKLAKNISFLRKQRGITQDVLADFLGVTKASVSKWETGQGMPDIVQLPRMAAYFDVSIDELMGYQAQLTEEEIQKAYQSFALAFGQKSFEEVMKESRQFVKEYYSCYPAVVQMILLWLNHYNLAKTETEQQQILKDILKLCEHVERHCGDRGLCSDAMILKNMTRLLMGETKELIEELEPLHHPQRLEKQAEGLLIQAYQMQGEQRKGNMFNQYMIYSHLLALVGDSIAYLMQHLGDKAGEETIERLEKVIDTYQLEKLHPNTTLQFKYTAALFYCVQGQKERALEKLERFVKDGVREIKAGITLHGDTYFTDIEEYFWEYGISKTAPRGTKTILDSIGENLQHPLFAVLAQEPEFEALKQYLKQEGGTKDELG